ncbi:DUF4148 domain-containing protein [Ramlibacter sp.]|uniref:DUF4148 domain-containing protein n=1 Tax=Ramlibacter sp. TaxID=1917967 RepID=UPI00183171FC|nr:DUF4148 domain-containing protein [Ramlibacter sp.]MBA2676047.1 hypothetical protein [Ramlibacter sp.]
MNRHLLLILAATALPFGMAHADEAEGSQSYRSGMAMHASNWTPGQQTGMHTGAQAGMQTGMQAGMQTTSMGAAPATRWLTREQVRAEAIQAMQQGTITRGEKGGHPQQ